jgi:hypothetical protein
VHNDLITTWVDRKLDWSIFPLVHTRRPYAHPWPTLGISQCSVCQCVGVNSYLRSEILYSCPFIYALEPCLSHVGV